MLVLADAIVVLGCVVRPQGEPSRALRRRIALANQAYSGEVASRIIVSGGRRHGGYLEADVMRDRLLQEGVPETAILVESRSLTTLENAYYSAQLLRKHGLQRVMVATQHWHMRRAIRAFQYFGVDALAPPADWRNESRPPLGTGLREGLCYWLDGVAAQRLR